MATRHGTARHGTVRRLATSTQDSFAKLIASAQLKLQRDSVARCIAFVRIKHAAHTVYSLYTHRTPQSAAASAIAIAAK